MNENVTLDGYFDEAREYIEANAKNEIQTERLNEMIFGLHEEWKHRAKTMDSNKNANETVNFNVQTIHVRNEIVKFAYDTDAIFNFIHRNTQYKPQKISFQALSSEILSPEYLNSGWIEELSPRICQNWKHDKSEILIIIMARKTAANPDAYYLDLRVRLSVGCKRRSYFFFLYLPVFSYLRLWYSVH